MISILDAWKCQLIKSLTESKSLEFLSIKHQNGMGANSMEISMDRDNTKLMLNELKGLDSILLATEQSFTLHFLFDVIS